MLALPKKRFALVDDEGGGGFWICDAVGARDWRIEYVRCIAAVSVCEGTTKVSNRCAVIANVKCAK